MNDNHTLTGRQVKLHNRRIALFKIPMAEFPNKSIISNGSHGFRISTKRLPESDESERIHKEKIDLTEEAMFAVISLWCKIEGFIIVPESCLKSQNGTRNGKNKP